MKSLKRSTWIVVTGMIFVILIVVVAPFASGDIAWRYKVLSEKLTGKLPEIPIRDLLRWLPPGSPVYLQHLAEVPNVNASITNQLKDPQSAEAGAKTYGQACAQCHGENGGGLTGPNLLTAVGAISDWSFFSAVKWGRPNTAMRAQPISDLQIWQVHAFIERTALGASIGKQVKSGQQIPFHAVPPQMLRSVESPGEWLTYSGNYAGYRHGSQTQITTQNVQNLRLAWVAQLRTGSEPLESTPIVAGDWMFVTEAPDGVTALNAKTGAVLWKYRRPVPSNIPLCCSAVNRGVAILNDSVYVETLDAYLVSLDAATGHKRWEVKVADWPEGYSMTGAPLAIDDHIVVGIAGGEFGIRGFLASYSAKDGSLQWKLYTVPGPGEPGHETWQGDDWKHGGAPTWTTGSYDPELGLIYWGTGNPSPEFNAKVRKGDNLYANSVIAVDAQSGHLRWYFQFTPSDDHDWDTTQQPVLTDVSWNGRTRQVLVVACRNGFFYVLDRGTGQFMLAKPFAKQTWASGIAPDGRPIALPEASPSRTGSTVWPGVTGATNWWPPSFDPHRQLLFVQAVDAASIYFSEKKPEYRAGEEFHGSTFQPAPGLPATTALRAIDITTGKVRWDSTLATGGEDVQRSMGGVLSTEGGLVFAGYSSEVYAFDADTGKKLWTTQLGATLHAPPITYSVGDQQFLAVIAGRTLFAFVLPASPRDKKRRQ
jgi:alcohol dehydrogenase (cytochrome c)